jgi:hypothetical protein
MYLLWNCFYRPIYWTINYLSMKIKLMGRHDCSEPLVKDPDSPFVTYALAVILGQQRYGKGNFLVDTGGRIPTRSEQLLRGKSKRKMMLESL